MNCPKCYGPLHTAMACVQCGQITSLPGTACPTLGRLAELSSTLSRWAEKHIAAAPEDVQLAWHEIRDYLEAVGEPHTRQYQRAAGATLSTTRPMTMKPENDNNTQEAASLHLLGRTTEGRALNRPTAAGWWWHTLHTGRAYSPRHVYELDGALYCHELVMSDKPDCSAWDEWRGEWVGPLTPPVGPTGGHEPQAARQKPSTTGGA